MYFPQTTNDLKTCTGPGGSPSCADMLGTIGVIFHTPLRKAASLMICMA